MKIHVIIFSAVLAISASIIVAEEKKSNKIPPLGDRKYVVESQDPFAPVEITAENQKTDRKYLKDPNVSSIKGRAKPLAKKKVVVKKPAKTVAKLSRKAIKFKPVKVKGDLIEPRVGFTLEALPVGRVDEPLKPDFYNKVFDPAKDRDF